jgi:hypothetical protein
LAVSWEYGWGRRGQCRGPLPPLPSLPPLTPLTLPTLPTVPPLTLPTLPTLPTVPTILLYIPNYIPNPLHRRT